MNEVEKIILPSGGWVEVKKWLSRGDRKQLNRLERQWLKVDDMKVDSSMTPTELTATASAAVKVDSSKVDPDAIDDLTMKLAIVSWSFSGPVTTESLDALDDRDCSAIAERLHKLYLTPAEKEVLGLKKD